MFPDTPMRGNPTFIVNRSFKKISGPDANRDLDNTIDRITTIKRSSNRLLVFIIQSRNQQSERPV